jgi:hypothetical protein
MDELTQRSDQLEKDILKLQVKMLEQLLNAVKNLAKDNDGAKKTLLQ